MAHYKIDSSSQTEGSRRLLIGLPLMAVSVFCFGFVLMHPQDANTGQAPATAHSTASTTASTQLSPISSTTGSPAPTKLTPATVDTNPAPATGNNLSTIPPTSPTPATTSPQLSTTGTASLQSALPNTFKASTADNKNPTIKSALKALVTKVLH